MKHLLTILCLFSCICLSQAQELPFKSIAETETTYSAGNVAARMVEGFGFRFYWATEGLTEEDLKFAPTEAGRNSLQTVEHVFSLSLMILKAAQKEPMTGEANVKRSFEEVRAATLKNLEATTNILKDSKEEDFSEYMIRFGGGGGLPFWNVINGPIADAIYHTGQIVLMRRMSGNPMNPKVNVLAGTGGE